MLSRIIACKNRELLDSIGSETYSQCASWGPVHVVIDADAIQASVILARPAPGYRHLVAEAALRLPCLLRTRARNPGFQGRQVRSGTTIQWEIADTVRINDAADCRARRSFGCATLW